MRCVWKSSGTGSGPAAEQFADSYWRVVNLPHDWAIELPFDRAADGSHGFKALGPEFPTNSIGWYRRTFELPKADEGKRIWLTFDGVFRDATVWVNGWLRAASRGRLLPVPRGHHGRGAVSAAGTPSPCAWTRRSSRAGSTKARASTATSGWTRPRRWPSRRTGFLFIRRFKNNVPAGTAGNPRRSRRCSTQLTNAVEGDGELRNHFAGRQIAETVSRNRKS